MNIEQWLHGLGLDQYVSAFVANDIDVSLIAQLTDADLKELGVLSLGHRKRILAAVATPAALAPQACAETQERRLVTIVFADLCGFTALSHSLDPEELRALIGRYTALVDGIVLAYGGTIDKHIGDAVMALFGAPRAHETDTLRAARAALDIHDALAQLSVQAARPLRAHIGIASGEVVAGALGRADAQDYTVHGDPVNLAARLVAAAGAGETWLSDDAARVLGDAAVCEPIGEQHLKGIDTPVRAWRLCSVANEPAKASRSRFVGRDAELEQFHGIAHACVARRTGHVIHVRGEAGIGKTRLVDEMRRHAQTQGFTIHRGLVLDFGVGKGQDPVRAIVGSLLGLQDSASIDMRQAAVARLTSEGILNTEQIVFLHDLLDLPQEGEWQSLYDAMDHGARKRGKQKLAATLTAHTCGQTATLIVVEDVHWADPEVLDYVVAFASGIADGPGLLVTTSRVEGDPLDAAWRARCRNTPFATIDLGPLRNDEALSLAGNFINATQRIALACIDRAGGNPLFLEQLLRNAEEGSSAVPASIRSLVLARMDRLAPGDRVAFQAAAVIGQRFGIDLLRRLVDDRSYVCDGLIVNALVVPEGDDFLFAHALIQESAYSTLLRARRRELHQRAAEWFAHSDPTLHAQHLDRAEDERAPAAYLAAALALRAAHLIEAALRLAERGLELARTDMDHHELICCKGELQRDLGDIAGSIATYRAALAAAPDDAARCRCQLGLAEGLRVSEGLDEALDLLAAAQPVAERDDRVADLANLHHLRGNILFPLGKIDACGAEHERGLAYARRLGLPEAQARALGGLADAAYAQGRMRTAFRHFSDCVELSREHGLGRIEVANRSMQGFSRMYLNDARQAREDADAAARTAALIGQPRAQLLGETLGVFVCYEIGDEQAARVHLAQGVRLIRQLGARRFEAQNLEMQGRLLLDSGCRREAIEAFRESLAVSREVGMQFCAPKTMGALCLALDDPVELTRRLAEGEELLRLGAVGHNHLWFYRDAIEAMLAAGDAAGVLRYSAALENYTRREPLPWADLFTARGRALARTLQGTADEATKRELEQVRTTLRETGFRHYLPAVDAALAA
ncbi:adenylate/guanylate cyclase domain-containing protein [Paraburkholderia dinghuensis]|uniref:Adenylate/guanylate cyclase domain-containing protein n=1 Tax=Paraburkholderia dinghuensis TaxID=2305225 RepID=A0A3N6MU04_9BURK|nr:adenylate/guanylate cyclase domain-containing protein [Paraburkholderia dinghuensis]RQH07139.1 adenylate/guanylate cyclase domain-containing protein [Paraburkholderia dinghuensis]